MAHNFWLGMWERRKSVASGTFGQNQRERDRVACNLDCRCAVVCQKFVYYRIFF